MREITLRKKKNATGQYILEFQEFPETPDSDCVLCSVIDEKNEKRQYPIFRQAARTYGEWNDYLEHHGCAVCSLTAVLNSDPVKTITQAEKRTCGEKVWQKNYEKVMRDQMPISMYGISSVLESSGISNRYISNFQKNQALREIAEHLYRGKPVIVEARLIKMFGKIPVGISKKYAGSYHTMILLGFTKDGEVIFTDSAHRDWAGNYQRLKKTNLSDLIKYMYGKTNPGKFSFYFKERKYSGGYILVDF